MGLIGRAVVGIVGTVFLLASSVSAGIVVECFEDADCDDGLFCTGTESCVDNTCVGLSACPPFVDGCITVTGCDEVNDTCIIGPDDSLCDDGQFCNGVETCDGETGSCVAVSSCPPFVDGCVVYEGCDEETDTCLSRPDDSLCDDGQFCNGVESCDDETASCVAVSACPPFVDGCITNAGCDEETDTCLQGPDDSLCDDGEFCNGVERCNGETGGCEAVSSCPPFVDGCLTNAGCDEAEDVCLVGPDDALCAEGETCLPSGECVTTTTSTSTSSTSTTTTTVVGTTTTTSTTLGSTTTTSTTIATSTTLGPSTTTTSTPTTTSSTTTTLAGTTKLLPATKLLVKQKKSGAQRLLLIVRDDAVMASDPCETDGALVIEPAGGPSVHFDLLADLWRPLKAKKPEKGCKYRKGPVVATVQVKTGKMLKVIANADDLGIPLATDPRPVRIEVRHGEWRHCVEFGGAKAQHKPDKKLLAKNASLAPACPGDVPPPSE